MIPLGYRDYPDQHWDHLQERVFRGSDADLLTWPAPDAGRKPYASA